jgi:hypothetical protein
MNPEQPVLPDPEVPVESPHNPVEEPPTTVIEHRLTFRARVFLLLAR